MIQIRKPNVTDVESMITMMRPLVLSEQFLPRTARQVAERLRDYVVATEDDLIVGVASVCLVDLDLAEVGVLTGVDNETKAMLLNAVLQEARGFGVQRAFVLTGEIEPFVAAGFTSTSLSELPEKRDRQCLRCPRLPRCRQVALKLNLSASSNDADPEGMRAAS